MNTIYALLILIGACTVGLLGIAIVMIAMGLGGAPGAVIYAMGQKNENSMSMVIGLLLCTLGQAFVVGAYTSFVVGLLWWFSAANPNIPTWPLWIAAFFHATAVPVYAMRERPEVPTAQHLSLGFVSTLSLVQFFLIVFAPQVMSVVYGWIPLYGVVAG